MGDTNTTKEFYETLDNLIWTTKHCRFIAANRLQKRYLFSQFTVALLSVFCIFLSLSDKYIHSCTSIRDNISLLNILLSVFIIVLSLFEASANHNGRSDRLYSCANKSAGLLLKLKLVDLSDIISMSQLDVIRKEYTELISKYHENHEKYDYDLFQSQRPIEFKIKLIKRLKYKLTYFVLSYGFYIFLIILPLTILLLIMCGIVQ